MSLNKEQIISKHGASTKTIPVEEWGGDVIAKRITAPDFIALCKEFPGKVVGEQISAYLVRLLQMTLVDEAGSLMFAEDATVLIESPLIVNRLGIEVAVFNGLWSSKDDPPKNH